MGIWLMMLGFNLLIPAIMLGAGKLFTKNTPKDINWIIGYRTTMSMKNEDTWAFAHKVAGAFWWKWGWVALVITVVGMLLLLGRWLHSYVCTADSRDRRDSTHRESPSQYL